MKNKIILSIAVLLLVLLFSSNTAFEDKPENESNATYVLSLSLQEIEDEAFLGAPAEVVILPEGLLKIGDKAFADAQYLRDVYIPGTTEYIADTAFSITSDLTIHGIDGSYAKNWAYKHEIPFVADHVWNVIAQGKGSLNTRTDPVYWNIAVIVLIILFVSYKLVCYEVKSKRLQDRPEFYPADYAFP